MQPMTHDQGFEPLVLHFGQFLQKMSEEEFFEFCQRHPDLRLERTSEGDLIIMPPTGGETGRSNFKLTALLATGWKRTEREKASIPLLSSDFPTALIVRPMLRGFAASDGKPSPRKSAGDFRPSVPIS